MNVNSRIPDAIAEELPRELVELGKRLSQLPPNLQGDLPELYNHVVESVRRRRRILTLVQEALSQLRLDIKYLMFDLEATRQERDALQGMRDESSDNGL